MGQPEKALEHFRQGLASLEKLLATDPSDTRYVHGDALFYKWLGNAHTALGTSASPQAAARRTHWADARAAYEKARTLFADLESRGVVRAEGRDMLEKLTADLAKCDAEIARLPGG